MSAVWVIYVLDSPSLVTQSIRQGQLPIPDACAAGRSRLARCSLGHRESAASRWWQSGALVSKQNPSCVLSSLLRPSGCDRFWHLGSAPLGSLGSSPRFGILFWRFPRSTDFTANPLSSSAADCQFSETRCVRRQEYRKEGLIDEVSMRAVVQIIRIVRHWPCHSSASKVVWLNAGGRTDSQ